METETLGTSQEQDAHDIAEERRKEAIKLQKEVDVLPVAFKFKDWKTTRKAVWILIGLSLVFGLVVLAR